MTTVVLILAAGVLVIVGCGVLDNCCAVLAEHKAGQILSVRFGHPATVRVHGRPLLPQVLRGRYRSVEVRGTLRVGQIRGATLVAELNNAYLPARVLLRRARVDATASETQPPWELPCGRIAGHLILPYDELARISRVPGLSLVFDDGRLLASVSVPVPGRAKLAGLSQLTGLAQLSGLTQLAGLGELPGLRQLAGQLVRLSGQAVLTVGAGNAVRLRLHDVDISGIALPALVRKQLLPALDFPIPLPPLPYGLGIDDLYPTPDGVLVTGSADAAVLRPRRDLTMQDGRPDS